MDDPDMNAKSVKFRTQFLDPDGKIVNCAIGDKLFVQTKLTHSAEPSTQNFHLFVKSIIKTITGNTVTISEVEIVGEFKDPSKQSIIKNLDLSKFVSQFRNRPIKHSIGGNWAIVHSGTPSGLSRTQFQEDLPKAMGLSVSVSNDDTAPPQQNLSELQALADTLQQFDLSKVEVKTIHDLIYACEAEIQCVISVSDIIQAHTQQPIHIEETSLKYILVLQALAEHFGTTLLPDKEQGSLSKVAIDLTIDQVDILERSVNKIVHRITLDDDSIKLSNLITNPTQYGKFLTTVNNTLKVIEKALSDKKATANSSTNEELARNVLDPSSPQNPHGRQPVSEIQQLMNMMTEQNRVANLSWINIANDIAQNKALLTANKTETDNTLTIMQKTMQDLTVHSIQLKQEQGTQYNLLQ